MPRSVRTSKAILKVEVGFWLGGGVCEFVCEGVGGVGKNGMDSSTRLVSMGSTAVVSGCRFFFFRLPASPLPPAIRGSNARRTTSKSGSVEMDSPSISEIFLADTLLDVGC